MDGVIVPWWEKSLPQSEWAEAEAFDEAIAKASFKCCMGWLDALKEMPAPIPYGKSQYFQSLIPSRDPDEILGEHSPYWWAYAETVRELKELFFSLPKQEFVEKKKK